MKVIKKLEYIFPEDLIQKVNQVGGFYVAGGAITSIVTNKEINDIDIYFKNKESLLAFVDHLSDMSKTYCTFISSKSLNYKVQVEDEEYDFQLIHYDFYDNLQQIFDSFDYTINMAGWDSKTGKVESHEDFLLHNSQRYLKYNPKTKFPLISALRVQKYKGRGYYISKSEYLKIMFSIMQLKIGTWQEFKDQCGNLYGLDYVKDKHIQDKEFNIENAMEVIESIDFDQPCESRLIPLNSSVIKFVLNTDIVPYCKIGDGNILSGVTSVPNDTLQKFMSDGLVKGVESPLETVIGGRLYKWVRSDLRSHYDRDFQYVLGEEAIANNNKSSSYFFSYDLEPSLYLTTREGVNGATYSRNGKLLECTYYPEDVQSVNGTTVKCKKVTPVRVFDSLEEYYDSLED